MSGPSNVGITALFKSNEAKVLGINKEASDIMISGLNDGNLPYCVGMPVDQFTSDNVVIIEFFLDASPSMGEVADLLIDTFNDTMIGGLRGASKQTTNTIVIGGLVFSSDLKPLWNGGFINLADVPKLTKREYNPSRGHGTNLYQAQHDAIIAAGAYGTKVLQETGTPPKIFVIGLTDGADNHGAINPADIKKLVESMTKEFWKFPLAVFETYEANHVDGCQIARDTGFDVFESKPQANESKDDIRRRFRRTLGTMSSSLVTASKTQIGTTSQTSFWQQ